MSRVRRLAGIEKDHPRLIVRRQCCLLSLTRSTLYATPAGESAENLTPAQSNADPLVNYWSGVLITALCSWVVSRPRQSMDVSAIRNSRRYFSFITTRPSNERHLAISDFVN